MRILAVADVEERALWEGFCRSRFEDVDLVLAAGDLDADYLEFLVTMLSCPVLYVHGNHDEGYRRKPPLGCICVDGSVYIYRGLRIVGLGGSMRYKDGTYMSTEREMRKRIRKVESRIRLLGGFDVLLAHAPARGMGDLDDLPHRGFECFNDLAERWRPALMVHGHVHANYLTNFSRERELPCGTRVVNAFGHVELDAPVPRQLSYGWKEHLVNRRALRESDGIASQEEGLLGAGQSYGQRW